MMERPVKHTRRRSLKAILQIPSIIARDGSIKAAAGPSVQPAQVGSVPADIILEIAEYLWPTDVLNFSLASSYYRSLLTPCLYDTVVLKSSRSCRQTLKMLEARPEICNNIKKIAVRPNYYLAWPRANEHLDEDWVVSAIEHLASNLKLLHTFDWDGLEMPKDSLWKTLREQCPLLRTMYTNVGFQPLDPSSSLFDFKDLKIFSLTVRHGLGGSELFPTPEALPPRLWEMLTDRCPELTELTLCSFSSCARVFDISPLFALRFPKLDTLTLGSFGYQMDFTLLSDTYAMQLGGFLSSHPDLSYLRLSWNFKRWLSPDAVPLCLTSDDALSGLKTFVGIYQQLAEVPRPETIESVDLTCEPVYDAVRIARVSRVLQRCISLTSLDVWVHVEGEWEGWVRDMLLSVPNLEDFHFMCTTGFGVKAMKYLSSLLHHLPRLRTFSLTKGHQYLDHEPMLHTAQRIFRMNPQLPLQQVNVRWARERCANHLKQEGTYDVDGDDRQTLLAWERGITVLGTTFERKFKCTVGSKRRFPGKGRSIGKRESKVVEVVEMGMPFDAN